MDTSKFRNWPIFCNTWLCDANMWPSHRKYSTTITQNTHIHSHKCPCSVKYESLERGYRRHMSSNRPGFGSPNVLCLSVSPVAPTLEHRASVKRFVSLQFLNPKTVGRTPWTGISPSQGRYLHKHRINTDKHPCLEWYSNPRSHRSSGRRQFMP
jgi:hypothetical protein